MGISSPHQAGCAIPTPGTNSVPTAIAGAVADHLVPSADAAAVQDTVAVATVAVVVAPATVQEEACAAAAARRRITLVATTPAVGGTAGRTVQFRRLITGMG